MLRRYNGIMDVNVISSYIDGAELKREKRKNPMHTRATGKHDEQVIKEACVRASRKSLSFALPDGAWERIFRKT